MNAIESTMADRSKNKVNKYLSVPGGFNNVIALIKYFIMENSPKKFLLGSDFMTAFQINMKYENKQ